MRQREVYVQAVMNFENAGADNNLRQYHAFEGMHPHDENWNVHESGV